MSTSWRFGVLLALLLVGGVVVNAWQYLGEVHVERQQLKDFPREMGAWQQLGVDQRFEDATLAVLGASDYVLRDYRMPDGRFGNFYVGYYVTQSGGVTYHSPLNCLPGAGWVMNHPGTITIKPTDGKPPFEANRYLIENGGIRSVLVYWYQGRGRNVASEYWGKIYTVVDSVRLRRSDGAMVRVIVPVRESETAALETAANLAGSAATVLPAFVPN